MRPGWRGYTTLEFACPLADQGAAMKSSDKQATAELLAALVEVAIAHGRRHYSQSGEPWATTLAVLECLQREGFVSVEEPGRRRTAMASAAETPQTFA